jgi:CyaY protein
LSLSEAEYRKKIQETFDRIQRAFENVDPDAAECEIQFGALTVTFPDRTKCILSAQPSVRQLWLALASRGTAYHFDYHLASSTWVDDKGKGIELISFLETFFRETLKTPIAL